jgi:hypothetical protein
MNNTILIGIKEASKILGVSLDTLRRWDKNGKLISEREDSVGARYYSKEKIDTFLRSQDIFSLAKRWVTDKDGNAPADIFYCQNSSVFQGRLSRLESDLSKIPGWDLNFSILSLMAGEIGDNSFAHNLGNWPDVPGIFFAYNNENREIVLADRGRGILKTLRAIRPELINDATALKVAFTEILSGRAPESRGNGLKSVRMVVKKHPVSLFFQSGNAVLKLKKMDQNLNISISEKSFHGCLALIKF